MALPTGPKVVPFWDYPIEFYEPPKGTTLGPMGNGYMRSSSSVGSQVEGTTDVSTECDASFGSFGV